MTEHNEGQRIDHSGGYSQNVQQDFRSFIDGRKPKEFVHRLPLVTTTARDLRLAEITSFEGEGREEYSITYFMPNAVVTPGLHRGPFVKESEVRLRAGQEQESLEVTRMDEEGLLPADMLRLGAYTSLILHRNIKSFMLNYTREGEISAANIFLPVETMLERFKGQLPHIVQDQFRAAQQEGLRAAKDLKPGEAIVQPLPGGNMLYDRLDDRVRIHMLQGGNLEGRMTVPLNLPEDEVVDQLGLGEFYDSDDPRELDPALDTTWRRPLDEVFDLQLES